MIRELINKLRGTLVERSHSARKRHNLPIKISFDPQYSTGKLNAPDTLYISGETADISSTGVGFIVSAIRVRENYLVGQDRILNAEIDLPGGKVKMKLIGRRYEKVGIHLSTERFLIGAEITEMDADQRERYEYFLRFGGRRGGAAAPSYEMGVK
jgi:c-di-GMP-binding flagellar brake protein YcgR